MFSPPFLLPFTMYITSLSQELSILFFGRRLKASTLSPVFLLFAPALYTSHALVHNFPFFTYGKIYSATPAAMIASVFSERKKLPILRKSKYQEFQCRKRHMFVATSSITTRSTLSFRVSMPQAAYVRCNLQVSTEEKHFLRSFNAASGICSLQHTMLIMAMLQLQGFNAASGLCSLQL